MRFLKGIGAGIAKAFSAEGASVVVNYSSSKEGADRVLARIAHAGGNAIAIQASVSNPEDVKRLFSETKALWTARHPGKQRGSLQIRTVRECLRGGIPSRILYERAWTESDHSGGDQAIR